MTTVEQRIREIVAIEFTREVLAERARCAAVCREVAAEYEGHAGAVARQCAEAVERGPSAPGVG